MVSKQLGPFNRKAFLTQAGSGPSRARMRQRGRPAVFGGAMAQMVDSDSPLDGVQVLLVEDHELVREVISRLLAEYGAEVTATSGVAAALKAFERERPNVVLSSIEMPDADGYTLIRALRALPRDRGGQTPAVALTGLSTDEDEARALRAGFQYYVPKPVDARTLVGVVAGLAARSAAVRTSLRT
jgi:CheY-like chemotaxis protein